MDFETEGKVIGCGLLFLVGVLLLAAAAAVTDVVMDRNSFAAQTECEARRMTPRRQMLTSNVICVPVNTRQDTTTVNLNTKQP